MAEMLNVSIDFLLDNRSDELDAEEVSVVPAGDNKIMIATYDNTWLVWGDKKWLKV